MVVAFALKRMVPCLLNYRVAQIIVVAQEPIVVFIIFVVIFVIILGIWGLYQMSVSPTIIRRVDHTF